MSTLFQPQESPQKEKPSESYSADVIEVLEGLEAVRRRPGMYIGGTDTFALHHMAQEIIDNSIDEAVAGHATDIWVALCAGNTLEVRDNGRGIPTDPHPKFPRTSALEVILTTLHAGGKFSGKAYETAGGLHGVGLSVVNALADELRVIVHRKKDCWTQTYSRGKPTSELQHEVQKAFARGTTIQFHPDPEIFGNLKFCPKRLYEMLKVKAALHAGVKVHYAWDKEEIGGADLEAEILIHYPDGILQALKEDLGEEAPESIYAHNFTVDDPVIKGSFALCWPMRSGLDLKSFCNTIPTDQGGVHETGFRQGIAKALKTFGEMSGIKKATILTPDDIFSGSCGWLSVFIPDPQFQGQTKEKLVNKGLSRPLENAIKEIFQDLLIKDPQPAKDLVELLIRQAEARKRLKQEREVLRQTATRRLRLPGKLTDCTSSVREQTELFLVEGDSAGGSAKQARERKTQAILPLRGKILNVASASSNKMVANQGIQDIALALGCGTGKNCKAEDLRYGRVIIMTDADVDGAHIASLLMTFFFTQMRPIVEKGHLYLAQPPLYRITAGTLSAYAADDAHRDELLATTFKNRKIVISRFKGLGEMSWQQLKTTTMSPKTRILLKVLIKDHQPVLVPEAPEEAVIENEEAQEAEVSWTSDNPDLLVDDLMGKKPEKRFAFIQENASYATDLDV